MSAACSVCNEGPVLSWPCRDPSRAYVLWWCESCGTLTESGVKTRKRTPVLMRSRFFRGRTPPIPTE